MEVGQGPGGGVRGSGGGGAVMGRTTLCTFGVVESSEREKLGGGSSRSVGHPAHAMSFLCAAELRRPQRPCGRKGH